MSRAPRASGASAALEMFHDRELSREARAKIELLERRLTTSERSTPPSASREGATPRGTGGGAERCAMEDSASDSSEDEGGGTRAYGVVDARASASGGKKTRRRERTASDGSERE